MYSFRRTARKVRPGDCSEVMRIRRQVGKVCAGLKIRSSLLHTMASLRCNGRYALRSYDPVLSLIWALLTNYLQLHGNVYGMAHLRHICDVLAVHEHCTRGGIIEPEDQPQGTGLAAAWQCSDTL